jgi:hypothetical protein
MASSSSPRGRPWTSRQRLSHSTNSARSNWRQKWIRHSPGPPTYHTCPLHRDERVRATTKHEGKRALRGVFPTHPSSQKKVRFPLLTLCFTPKGAHYPKETDRTLANPSSALFSALQFSCSISVSKTHSCLQHVKKSFCNIETHKITNLCFAPDINICRLLTTNSAR